MVRVTAELIQMAPQFLNTLKDRELDLRANKIPTIENLGATLDQFDTIDFSDNDIVRLDGFPHLKRVKTIFANNNRISKISLHLKESLPNLEELILTNNNLQEFADLEGLGDFTSLKRVCFLRNPVANKKHYREFLIYTIPSVVLVDFRRVKQKEREEAAKLFGPGGSHEVTKTIRTYIPGEGVGNENAARERVDAQKEQAGSSSGLTTEQVNKIKDAIARASSLDEVRRLEGILQSGIIPDETMLLSVPV
eukprot:Ihof_evm1s342 gene=Ihof_evmTU1s342